jgi:hypothetical protein
MEKKEIEKKADAENTEPEKEFGEGQVWMVGKCQVAECGEIRSLAKVSPRASVVSAGGDVQICRPCYTKHFRGCKIVKKRRDQKLMFKEGEPRRLV